MWQSPWDNAVPGGDQVTHAIWALATGGSFGTGLGLGDTRYLPAGHTDLILAAIGEELGAAGLLLVAVPVRAPRLARLPHRTARAKRLRFLPRHRAHAVSDRAGADHGVRHPWRDAAHGRRDAVSELRRVGDGRELLCAGHADGDSRRSSPLGRFRAVPRSGHVARVVARVRCAGRFLPWRSTSRSCMRTTTSSAPHLGIQADGGRRFEYNPRVLDIVRLIPRGTIYDRRGVPLATDDPSVIADARQTYATLGVSVDDTCPMPGERCYPLGGAAFHLLGDARTRRELDRAQLVVHRARCRTRAARLRRSRRRRAYDGFRRPAHGDDQARLPRPPAGATASLRSSQRGVGAISSSRTTCT